MCLIYIQLMVVLKICNVMLVFLCFSHLNKPKNVTSHNVTLHSAPDWPSVALKATAKTLSLPRESHTLAE